MQTQDLQKTNLHRVLYIGICFTTLFTAFIAAQNLVSQLYTQLGFNSLGQICIFIYFTMFAMISIVSAHLKRKISVRTGLILGASAHVGFVFAGALTSLCYKYDLHTGLCSGSFIIFFNLLSATFLGTGAAFLWLCQATYVNSCTDEQSKGFLNGIFWSVFQSAQIFSCVLAAVLLGSTDQFTFYFILLIFGVAGITFLFFLKPAPNNGAMEVEVSNRQENIRQAARGFFELTKEKKYYFLYIGTIFAGVSIGCYISFIATAIGTTIESESTQEINRLIGYVLIVLSCGEVAAGVTMGRLADKYDKIKMFTVSIIINEAALVFTFLACLFKSYKLMVIGGFLFGYGDTATQTMINTCIGFLFQGKTELFSAYRFFQGVGMMFSAILNVIVPRENPMVYIVAIACSMVALHSYFNRYATKASSEQAKDSVTIPLIEMNNMASL